MDDNLDILMNFLPLGATVLEFQKLQNTAAILLADIDGDYIDELVGAYTYEEENYILILKNMDNQWLPLIHVQGSGHGISDLLVAPLTDNWVNTLIVGWQIGDESSQLDLFQWKNSRLVRLPTNNLVYSKLEVEDMPNQFGQDGQYELAVWVHDTGDAYKVDVYRFSNEELIQAKDVYPYYFKKVEAYYERLLQTNDYSYYWYYLSDAQKKLGNLGQNLTSIDTALSFHSPYPSKEKLLDKRQQVLSRLTDNMSNDQVILDEKRGDVTGDGFIDTVYLTGSKIEGNPFWQDIILNIFNGKTNVYERIPLKDNVGSNPSLFLGDFTGNSVDDILLVLDTGGNDGTISAYVFTFMENTMQQVFDSKEHNNFSKYEVNYENQYKVTVTSSAPNKKYILDLSYKSKDYLSGIYYEDGMLIEPIEGRIEPISELYPADFEWDGTFKLITSQVIVGKFHADVIGSMQNVLKWNGNEFVLKLQTICIFGENLASI